MIEEFININKKAWDQMVEVHFQSSFYDNESFLKGRSSLNSIELDLLGSVKGKSILHLQCHFGQDSISLSKLGAKVTAIDFSELAIEKANQLKHLTNSDTTFICCNLYDLPNYLDQKFDIVFTSYGTIAWLDDLHKWSSIIHSFLKPKGEFIFAEFHPVLWMFDDKFEKIQYSYYKSSPIHESVSGSYANPDADILNETITWNHSLAEIFSSLLLQNLQIISFNEFDYSPYNCFENTIEVNPNQFRIKHLAEKIPMIFSLKAVKK